MRTQLPLKARGGTMVYRSVVFLYFLLFIISYSLQAQTLPANFSRVQVVGGLTNPTAMAFTPDGRVLICQQQGALRVVKNGSLLATPAISLSVNSDGERGLIGVAVDPAFSTNRYVYLYYSTSGTVRNRVSRFTMNGDILSAETVIFDFPNDSHMYHNGGGLAFGKDGKLYILSGDDKNSSNAQNLESAFGKVLRINADGSVPSGNPFTGSTIRSRIWAYGVRNPFTLASDPVSGKLFINDVGESTWEEIDNATTGGINFGWPNSEGTCSGSCNPVYKYNTNRSGTPPEGQGCAISGGTFFNSSISNYPSAYNGKYFFLDYCAGWINYIDPNNPVRQSFATGLGDMVYLVQGPDGNLYYLRRGNGSLNRIVYTGTNCAITQQPQNRTVNVGQSATFSVTATGSSLTYQWRKNSVAISGATGSSYTLTNAQTSDAGNYSVVISGTSCSLTSNQATLTVNDNNTAPVATITLPANNSFFTPGQTVSFSGNATDTEDGTLPASAFNWEVTFHHATHVHPGPNVSDGVKNGSFVTDDEGHTDADIWYRISLTVTDAQGKQGSAYVDVYPALPAPWNNADIGAVAAQGAVGYSGGAFALKGSGADIWGTADEFHYVYQQVSGDVEITGLVERMGNPNAWSKTGFMIRQSLNANSAHAMIAVTPTNGIAFQRRTATAGVSTNTGVAGVTTPVWLRLKRTGNTLTVSRSTDGNSWQQVGTQDIALGSTVYIGMVLTSHADGTLGTSVISNVNVITGGNQSPSVNITSPASNASYAAPANVTINATATDNDGTVSKVEFYNGNLLLGTDNSNPYSFDWNAVSAGTYTLTAKATDDDGAVTTSAIVTISVTATPTCDPVVASADDGNIAANVLDKNLSTRWSASGDGQWIRFCLENNQNVSGVKIAFFKGNERRSRFDIQLSSDGTNWTTVASNVQSSGTSLQLETFGFTAQNAKYVRIVGHGNNAATGNLWNSYTEVEIITGTTPNQAPITSISAPANNTSYTAPGTIAITATASDSDGNINQVDFYSGNTLLGSDNTSPYSYTWNNVAAGNYNLTVKATDDQGAVTTSAAVSVTVNTNNNTCSNIAPYTENGGYIAGSIVTHAGKKYECRPHPNSGWCNGAAWAYAPGSGSYWQDAWIDRGSCSARQAAYSITSFEAYPNPCDQVVFLNLNAEISEADYQIINSMGVEVQKGRITNGNLAINISTQSSGLYLLIIKSGDEVWEQRVLKK